MNTDTAPKPLSQGTILSGCSENQQALLSVVSRARHELLWFSEDLDPLIADNSPLYEQLLHFLRDETNSTLRILIHQPQQVASRGHSLIALLQRLSSNTGLRKTNAQCASRQLASFVIADHRHLYLRSIRSLWAGQLFLDQPLRARAWEIEFNHIWDISDIDTELRTLHL